ncbi:MAG: hypothetical protein R3F19_11700 [Verrucomicrobiales bacterium]
MHDYQQSEVKAARLLELLQRAGQLDDEVEVSCSRNEVMRLVFKWLNRRSQRRSFTWTKFSELWTKAWQIQAPRCVEQGESSPQQPSLALA